ncbi:MAG: 2-hydroxyacid dehydrogenase [Verrucomicrobiota bacterium]
MAFRVGVFSTKKHDREFLGQATSSLTNLDLSYLEVRLTEETAPLARGFDAVCLFVHDLANQAIVETLAAEKIRYIAMRCAGFNNVDLNACQTHGIKVSRVPAYSPYAVAEHAVGMILELNRKYFRAHTRIRENNFSLDGLAGFDVHGKTVGVVGTGKIGECFSRIMNGFGCEILAYDIQENPALVELGVAYVELETLLAQSDMISLHCPLLPQTHHLINEATIQQMKPGVMIINTSRGGLISTPDVIQGIKSGQIGYLGLDVYEEEEGVFFEDLSDQIVTDDQLMRLNTFPNVLMTSHQAFFTREALLNIARTTTENLMCWAEGKSCPNEISG